MKRYQKPTPERRAFVAEIRAAEERLFREQLDPTDPRRLLSARRSWEYRPSHHISRGLLSRSDLDALSAPGRRVLSVGAYPACLEQLLCALGLPPENVVVADRDAAILTCAGAMEKVVFDAYEPWPDLGRFDLILFPESLAISLADRVAREAPAAGAFPNDSASARLLAHVLGEVLVRLRPGGEMRADGPMCHPNVVRAASLALDAAGHPHRIDYDRFFLRVGASEGLSETRFS